MVLQRRSNDVAKGVTKRLAPYYIPATISGTASIADKLRAQRHVQHERKTASSSNSQTRLLFNSMFNGKGRKERHWILFDCDR